MSDDPISRDMTGTKLDDVFVEIHRGPLESILAGLYRRVIMKCLKNPKELSKALDDYLSDRRNSIPQNTKDRMSARGQLVKEISKDTMTWKVLCKALRVVNIMKFDIIIRPKWANKRVSVHEFSVNLGDFNLDAEFKGPEGAVDESDPAVCKCCGRALPGNPREEQNPSTRV